MPSWLSGAASRRGKGRLESGPARLWRMSKLDRRFTFAFGVDGGRSDGGGSGRGRGDGGGEGEGLMDMDIDTRGGRWSRFSRAWNWACWWGMLCFNVES